MPSPNWGFVAQWGKNIIIIYFIIIIFVSYVIKQRHTYNVTMSVGGATVIVV
jgi:hypothetical protein